MDDSCIIISDDDEPQVKPMPKSKLLKPTVVKVDAKKGRRIVIDSSDDEFEIKGTLAQHISADDLYGTTSKKALPITKSISAGTKRKSDEMTKPSTTAKKKLDEVVKVVKRKEGPTEKIPKAAIEKPSKDEEPSSVPQKKKKRTREEIDQDNLAKEIAKVQREMLASLNSKCEQYLFCHISEALFNNVVELKDSVEKIFKARSIQNQIIIEKGRDNIVTFKRKNVDAVVENGTVEKIEHLDLENVFIEVIDGAKFATLVGTQQLIEHLKKTRETFSGESQITVVIYGKHGITKPALMRTTLQVFDETGVQLRFIVEVERLALIFAQFHRSLAKRPLSLKKDAETLMIHKGDKGIKEGVDLQKDWWTKMLSAMHRMAEDQKRAIIAHYPNVFELIQVLEEIGPVAGGKRIANIECENKRKIGPVLAQKLVQTLCSITGDEIIEC
uniref:Crossover junction endonuclease MUS81 n=1 Tax=Rhabditophanes sp. KR3021 TaxID=114890 RepID=A0AC35TRY3_9BILA